MGGPYDRSFQPRHHAPGGQGESTEQEHVYHQRQLQQTLAQQQQQQQQQQPQQTFPGPAAKGPVEESSKAKTRGKGKPKTFFKVTDTTPSNGKDGAENSQFMLPSAPTSDALHESEPTTREDQGPGKTPTARKGKGANVDTTTSDKHHRTVKREESSGASSMSSTPRMLNEKAGTESLLFGSGMILVKKLPDASLSGGGQTSSNEPTRPFPPTQLSMRGGHGALGQSDTSSQPGNANDPPTPALKGKRSKASLNQDSEATAAETGSMSSPPPPPPPAARGKAANRTRKGMSVSSDADIERSNQITRAAAGSTGPAWMTAALNSSSSTSTTSVTNGIRRRPPLPQPQPSEADKRKPKRIKIEYKDDDQVQGSSSTVTGTGGTGSVDKKKKKESKHGDSESHQPRPRDASKGQGEFGRDASGDGRKRMDNRPVEDGDHEDNLDDDETLEEDEVMEEGERDQSTSDVVPGSLKRRSPEDEDDDYPEGDGGSTVGGHSGRKQGGRRGGRAAGTGMNGKGKSASSPGSSVATNGAMDHGTASLSKKLAPSSRTESASEGDQSKTTDAPTPASDEGDVSKVKGKRKAKKSKIEREDSETEIEYLPMEDDIRCPNMFGLEGLEYGLEKESSDTEGEDDEEDEDDEDGDAKSEQQGDGKAGSGPGSSKKGNKSASASVTAAPTDAEDPIHAQGRQWVKKLTMPEDAWVESFNTYERVKRLKELKNRQPVRKREAILAAILYIVCRTLGSPRTFSEICTASGVKRGDIGSYYRLMLKVLEPNANPNASARDTDAEAFMVRPAAVHVFSQANTLNLTSGKCPSSVGAAAIYLCIYSWNDARRVAHCQRYQCPGCWRGIPSCSLASHNAAATLANGSAPVCTPTMAPHDHPDAEDDARWIRKEHKDVANAVGVVSATLMGCFKNLAPDRARLIPEEFLKVALKDE
ncbi:hypothetical protein BG005_007817 [Podila minutissima]|nr:hypothetical protein BG005_007817 [Podila minutissima]